MSRDYYWCSVSYFETDKTKEELNGAFNHFVQALQSNENLQKLIGDGNSDDFEDLLNCLDPFDVYDSDGKKRAEIGFDEELEYNSAHAVAFFLSMMLQDGVDVEVHIGDGEGQEGLYVTKGKIHFMHRVWEHEDNPCQVITEEMLAEALL
jgi:hypothetical protein